MITLVSSLLGLGPTLMHRTVIQKKITLNQCRQNSTCKGQLNDEMPLDGDNTKDS